jgi:hypothetical protein
VVTGKPALAAGTGCVMPDIVGTPHAAPPYPGAKPQRHTTQAAPLSNIVSADSSQKACRKKCGINRHEHGIALCSQPLGASLGLG